jgi:hypothetical protein
VRADVPGQEDLPQHALLSVVGQELSEVRPHAHVVPWPHAVTGVGGPILVDLGMEKHNCTRMKRWLRPRLLPLLLLICMIYQEPALFATTICWGRASVRRRSHTKKQLRLKSSPRDGRRSLFMELRRFKPT